MVAEPWYSRHATSVLFLFGAQNTSVRFSLSFKMSSQFFFSFSNNDSRLKTPEGSGFLKKKKLETKSSAVATESMVQPGRPALSVA